MKDIITIGKITGAHGLKGEIEVLPITDDENRFYDLKYFIAAEREYAVSAVRFHKGRALISSPDIADRTAAEHMRGLFVSVKRVDAMKLEEGRYFIEDLKGLSVTDTSGRFSGVTLLDVLQTGAADVLVFSTDSGEVMMPFLNRYIGQIDVCAGTMRADMSEAVEE